MRGKSTQIAVFIRGTEAIGGNVAEFHSHVYEVCMFSRISFFSFQVNISNTWTLPQPGFNVFYRYFRDKISWFEADAVCQFHHANLVTGNYTKRILFGDKLFARHSFRQANSLKALIDLSPVSTSCRLHSSTLKCH